MTKEKVRAQVKSRFYYVFWGTATVAVVFGQLYVGIWIPSSCIVKYARTA